MSARLSWIFLATLACSSAAFGCGSQATKKAQNEETIKQLQQFQAKREARAKALKAMDVPHLADELEKESLRGLEPFNSMAYAEASSRGRQVVGALTPLLTKHDRSSFLALMVIRKLDPGSYRSLAPDFKAAVLVNSLESSTYFNAWGIPTVYWADGAKAIIEEGSAVEPGLIKLLRDTRPAPVWGSEGVMVNQQYHFRVADYAWTLLNEIRNQRVEIPQNPEDRDKLISEMLKHIATRPK